MPVKRILLVDDEVELVKAIQIRLQQAGYEVLVAYNGQEGLEKAHREKPDLIILDLILPKMTGEHVCKEIRKDDAIAATPVIMLTAKGEDADRVIGRVIGADYYMTKPFEYQVLLDKTKELLKRRERMEGNMGVKRILLVDDEEELLKAMKIRLASWGYDVLTAANGKEAIQLVKKEVPDAIILDIMMPEMDGIETFKRIRQFNKKIPVFMLTAYGDEERFEKTSRLGIAGFIHKGTEFGNASEFIRVALRGVK